MQSHLRVTQESVLGPLLRNITCEGLLEVYILEETLEVLLPFSLAVFSDGMAVIATDRNTKINKALAEVRDRMDVIMVEKCQKRKFQF